MKKKLCACVLDNLEVDEAALGSGSSPACYMYEARQYILAHHAGQDTMDHVESDSSDRKAGCRRAGHF